MRKLMVIIPLLFLLSSCVSTGGGGTVTLRIEGYEKVLCEKHTMSLSAGSTVFDALKETLKEYELTYTTTGSGKSVYIESINNEYEFDHGPQSGWSFTVNGTYPSAGCGSLEISDGDKIVFNYTTEYEE